MESSVRGIIMILLKDVSYEWEDGRTALKNINIEIKKGEFILISGKSGSGKSTLGNVMNGLIPHYYKGKMQGKAFVSGKDISKLSLHEIGHIVGTVFQEGNLLEKGTHGELLEKDGYYTKLWKAQYEV